MPAVVRFVLCVGLLLAAWPVRAEEVVAGIVTRVRDGDTIVVGVTPVRLWGVAAPERDQPLGRAAGRFVRGRALARYAVCTGDGARSWDRVVARCRIDGRDLGRMLVAAGLARDCPAFSRGAYAAFEPPDAEIRRLYPLPSYCVPKRTAQLDGSSSTP